MPHYQITPTNLRYNCEFKHQAGTHWMWEDPDRSVGGKRLYASVHAPEENGVITIKTVNIKTGKYPESIGYIIDSAGRLHIGQGSVNRFRGLSAAEKNTVVDMKKDLEYYFRRYRES